jgi:N-acetylglucosamine-6-phosphate deacetylase
MLQPTHVVTDAMSTGGGVTSGQSHVQFRTIVVVSGVVCGGSTGVGSSLQFHVQFQTMVVGAFCAG